MPFNEQPPKQPEPVDEFGKPLFKKKEDEKPTPAPAPPPAPDQKPKENPIVDPTGMPVSSEKKPDDKKDTTPTPDNGDPYKGKSKEQIAKEFNERMKKISFVDVSSFAESEAIDAGEESMTRKKGTAGFFERIWKHNIMKNYYEKKAILEAQDKIKQSGNIYTNEGLEKKHHDEAMDAVVDKFTDEYSKEIIAKDADQRNRKLETSVAGVPELKTHIQDIIRRYARGELSDTAYEEERNRLLSQVTGVARDVIDDGSMYADNLKKVALQAKQAYDHGVALEDLDLDFDITVGRARSSVKSEAHLNKVDEIVKAINKSKFGALIGNET